MCRKHRLVWIGRVATGVMVLIGLAWIPVIQGGKGLYDYLQGVQAYLAPPIFVVFFLGVFWKRLNGAGCLAALIVGFLLGLFRLAVDTPVKLIDGFQVRRRLAPVDREQHVLPVLQHPDPDRLRRHDDRGQLRDTRAGLREDLRADVRHGDRRPASREPQQLGLARYYRLVSGPRGHLCAYLYFTG